MELLRWITGRPVVGFEQGKYRIEGGVEEALDALAETLHHISLQWTERQFELAVVGYGDSVPVKRTGIPLLPDSTGVAGLFDLAVQYSGCDRDRLVAVQPVFIPLEQVDSDLSIRIVRDNCGLGATRAFVTSAYLQSKLSNQPLHFSYGTGGVSRSSTNLTRNRKVDVTITIKAAREHG
jgi:hypothetical protein